MNAISDQQLTVDATSGGVSLTVPSSAKRCYIEIWTAAIYYTLDAVAPSSSNGGRAGVGDIIDLMGSGGKGDKDNMSSVMSRLRMLRQTATSALAIIHYFD